MIFILIYLFILLFPLIEMLTIVRVFVKLTRTRDKNSIKRITSKKKKNHGAKVFFWSKSTTCLKPKLHMNIIVHILNHGDVKPSFHVSNL